MTVPGRIFPVSPWLKRSLASTPCATGLPARLDSRVPLPPLSRLSVQAWVSPRLPVMTESPFASLGVTSRVGVFCTT